MTTIRTIICVLAVAAGTARADNKTKADELFKQAKKLLAEKRYSEACPKFEDSYKLDPGIGGELNIGKCFEEWGKLGRAYRAYVEAEMQAKEASDARQTKIHELVVGIEAQVPRLTIHIPHDADTDGLKVTIDGVEVPADELAKPQFVDPGPKTIEYTVAGQAKKSKLVVVERGGSSEITLDLPKVKVKVDPDKDKIKDKDTAKVVPATTPPSPGHTQRIVGIGVGSVGVVMMGVASYMTLSARTKYNDALKTDCNGMTTTCDAQGLTDTHDARHSANIATIVFSVGLAATAGGVVLYLLAPHAAPSSNEHALYVVPTVGADGAGLAFGGRM